MRKLPLSPSVLDALLALYDNEPATCRLISTALGLRTKSGFWAPEQLIRHGLATKARAARRGGLTEDERLGAEPARHAVKGRRPWVYRLTDRGRRVAGHLAQASESFHRPEQPQ